MNIAVIFAGGVGKRMKSKDKPKQFLMVHGKPIIVHTIELFENHPEIDGIICVIVKDWIPYMKEMKYRYRLDKIKAIVPGGETGQMSIYNGLCAAEKNFGAEGNIVLIHDGVRPLLSQEIISSNIAICKAYGYAITGIQCREAILESGDGFTSTTSIPRDTLIRTQTPQTFRLKNIIRAHESAYKKGIVNSVASCTLLAELDENIEMHIVPGSEKNIKITTVEDLEILKALMHTDKDKWLK